MNCLKREGFFRDRARSMTSCHQLSPNLPASSRSTASSTRRPLTKVPLLLPMSPVAFARSTLLSTRGKLRMFQEPFIPARTDDGDESLADFVSRRLGREALDKFLGPVLGGIYNTDPEQQSILLLVLGPPDFKH